MLARRPLDDLAGQRRRAARRSRACARGRRRRRGGRSGSRLSSANHGSAGLVEHRRPGCAARCARRPGAQKRLHLEVEPLAVRRARRAAGRARRGRSRRRWKNSWRQHAPVVGVVPDHLDRQHLGVAEQRVLVVVERAACSRRTRGRSARRAAACALRAAGRRGRARQLGDVGVGDRDEVAARRIERIEEQAGLAGQRPARAPRRPACSRTRSGAGTRSPAALSRLPSSSSDRRGWCRSSQSIALSKVFIVVERMQLRVGDDADRMRARRERDQPDPVAFADQVVGREPARRRVAARAPVGIVGPVVDRRCARRCGTRPRWRRARSARPARACA